LKIIKKVESTFELFAPYLPIKNINKIKNSVLFYSFPIQFKNLNKTSIGNLRKKNNLLDGANKQYIIIHLKKVLNNGCPSLKHFQHRRRADKQSCNPPQ